VSGVPASVSLGRRPPARSFGVHSPVASIPSRVPDHLPAVRPRGRTDSPELPGPFNGVPRASPIWGGRHPPRLRSRVFSTPQRFPGRPELRGLVSCRNRSWASSSPSEVSPREDRAPLSGPQLPCGHPPPCRDARPVAFRRRFHRTPAPGGAVARLPRRLGAPFPPGANAVLPGHPGPRAAEPPRSAGFTRFEAFLPSRVRSHRPGLPRVGGRSSPGVHPL
jgi:hypothetical protein